MNYTRETYEITTTEEGWGFRSETGTFPFRSRHEGLIKLYALLTLDKIETENALELLEMLSELIEIPLYAKGDSSVSEGKFQREADDMKAFLVSKRDCEATERYTFLACPICGLHGLIIGHDLVVPIQVISLEHGTKEVLSLVGDEKVDTDLSVGIMSLMSQSNIPKETLKGVRLTMHEEYIRNVHLGFRRA